jgi:hypothetical protein
LLAPRQTPIPEDQASVFPTFYGTPTFITTILINVSHWTLSWTVHTDVFCSFKIHINITLSSKTGFPKCFLPIRFSDQNFVYIAQLF